MNIKPLYQFRIAAKHMIDPITLSVVTSLVSSTLYSLVGQVGKSSERFGQHQKHKAEALSPTLMAALEQVAEEIDLQGVSEQGPICLFLQSPEAEAIIRQIYSVKLIENGSQKTLDVIRREFLTAFTHFVAKDEGELQPLSNRLFSSLVTGCELCLDAAIYEGVLTAHEAKSNLRYHLLRDEIVSLHKKAELFVSGNQPDVQQILKFEKAYRQQVATRHSHITPPNVDSPKQVHINQIYVQSQFIRAETGDEENIEVISHRNIGSVSSDALLSEAYRIVILGNPGGGKSTFSTKLCFDLASKYDDRLFAGRKLTPIFVLLREYGARKKERNYSILDFIKATANSDYQVPPPSQAFEYLLLAERVMVIFDGLDELLDTSYRQVVSDDVEAFCGLYPSVPVIVTSREVGYGEAPLNNEKFQTFRLASFDQEQVEEYVTKWFSLDMPSDDVRRNKKLEAFLQESKTVPDLRSNPLMLSLLCNIYRGENYLPKNRPDVYEKCANMLFERWDRSRSITVSLPFESRIKPALMYLAHWIYTDKHLQLGVTEEKLIQNTAAYLAEKKYEDQDEARAAAREFIDFCRGRAWVFTDTGTTKEGERLYQFTHRTFLEYFTAFYLIRNYSSDQALSKLLHPKIMREEWDVVAQLAFQLLNKVQEDADDLLLVGLVRRAQAANIINTVSASNLLAFAGRCLGFLVPSDRTIRSIVSACYSQTIVWFKQDPKLTRRSSDTIGINSRLLGNLTSATAENRHVIGKALKQFIIDQINQANDTESILALRVAFGLQLIFDHVYSNEEVRVFYTKLSREITDECRPRAQELAAKDFDAAYISFERNYIDFSELISWHGLQSVFRGVTLFPEQDRTLHCIAVLLFAAGLAWNQSTDETSESVFDHYRKNYDALLTELGQILLKEPKPWYTKSRQSKANLEDLQWYILDTGFETIHQAKPSEVALSDKAFFGALLIAAASLEEAFDGRLKHLKTFFPTRGDGMKAKIVNSRFLSKGGSVLLRRYTSEDSQYTTSQAVEQLPFNVEEKALVSDWLNRRINFVDEGKP